MTLQEKLDAIYNDIYCPICDLSAEAYCTEEPVPFQERIQGEKIVLRGGTRWGRDWSCSWIRLTGKVPERKDGWEVSLLLDVGGEACLYDEQGKALKGFTNVQSEFTVALGKPAKMVWILPESYCGKERTFWADSGANDLFGSKPENGVFIQAKYAYCNPLLRSLYYDLEVIGYIGEYGKNEQAKQCFDAAVSLWKKPEEAKKMTEAYLRQPSKNPHKVFALGNAHLDLAWLWPMRETKRKAVRTMATMVANMKRYPHYKFGVSQPQMLTWLKEEHPDVFEETKKLVADHRVELLGATWVEMDTNLPNGESLVRQFLYGMRYWKEEFEYHQKLLWLPDTFGYSAQLPQLMKEAGLPWFLTTKLSWNSVNKFPYQSFYWKGIDGTRILAHIPPEGNYNSAIRADSILKAENELDSVLLYGIGDGGGGPGMEHLERLSREENVYGLPEVKSAFAVDFFKNLESKPQDKIPEWSGEIYLEKHQGTYTTQGRIKRGNALCEREMHLLEYLASVALRLSPSYVWKKDKVDTLWEEILLYQFHDILPGSAIHRVYEETEAAYQKLLESIRLLQKEAMEAICSDSPEEFVLNATSFPREDVIFDKGTWGKLAIPAQPYGFTKKDLCSSKDLSYSDLCAENEQIKVTWSESGDIVSIQRKKDGKEFLAGKSNRLLIYQDDQDGWEVPDRMVIPEPVELTPVTSTCEILGDAFVRTDRYSYQNSTMIQKTILKSGSDCIEFHTEAEWNEEHRLLRAEFNPAIASETVECGIQFGQLSRPTMHRDSWEQAKREVCFQKFADLNDGANGFAVLSDCKYGIDVRDCKLSVALLRAPTFPDIHADIGHHEFIYAVKIHSGTSVEVLPDGYALTNPLVTVTGVPELKHPFVSVSGLVVDTIKPAEEGNGIVVRMYNPTGQSGKTAIRFAEELKVTCIKRVNILEKEKTSISKDITYGPYEIITILAE